MKRVFAIWMVGGALAGLAVAARGPALFGRPSLTVMSGSMEPTIGTGDVIVEERIPPVEARIDDVVTFRDPSDPSRLITHRVRSMRVEAGSVRFMTKGDANTATESWAAPVDGTIGRVLYRIPRLGYLVHWLGTGMGRMAMLAIPAFLLALLLLADIWRPKPARVES